MADDSAVENELSAVLSDTLALESSGDAAEAPTPEPPAPPVAEAAAQGTAEQTGVKKKRPQKKDSPPSAGTSRSTPKSPTKVRAGAQQPLRVAPQAEAGPSLADPGNIHPKRKPNHPRGSSGYGQQQLPGGFQGPPRRSLDAYMFHDQMRHPFPPNLRYKHQLHKCAWSDSSSVSSRSSTDLLSFPTPPRGGQGQTPHHPTYSYSVPTTPNQRSRRDAQGGFHPFDAFLPLCEIQAGLKRGEFFEGTLRVNPRRFEDSFISAPEGGRHWDIHIEGRYNRNRTFNGDLVAVQLLPEEEWKVHWEYVYQWERDAGCTIAEFLQKSYPSTVDDGRPDKSIPVAKASDDIEEKESETKTSTDFDDGETDENSSDDSGKAIDKPDCKGSDKHERRVKIEKVVEVGVSCDVKVDTVDDVSKEEKIVQDLCAQTEALEVGSKDSEDDDDEDDDDDDDGDDSHESHGDLAESLHFASNEPQHTPAAVSTSKSKTLNEPTASTTSSDEGNRAQATSEAILTTLALDKSKSKKTRQRKKRPTTEPDVKPRPIAELSEETSEHKEETQDEDNSSVARRKRRNRSGRRAKKSLVQRFNLTPEDLGFQSHIPEAENVPDPNVNYDEFVEITKQNAAELGVLGAMAKGSQQKKTKSIPKETQTASGQSRASPEQKPTTENLSTESQEIAPSVMMHVYHIAEILSHPEWARFVQRKGRVVGIIESSRSRITCGTLGKFNDNRTDRAMFSPIDSRIPRMWIPAPQCPPLFFRRVKDYHQVLFKARIEEWRPETTFARGSLLQAIGMKGETDAESAAILANYSIDDSEYTEAVFEGMQVSAFWKIPEEEIRFRRDFRKTLVLTIDPRTARDLDDAVSVVKLGDDLYEVGVHIADVGFFVRKDTLLDQCAQSRATSVYLVQKVVPMLPRVLCNYLCSLKSGSDKLTFSVVFKMNSKGEIFDEWFGKTIINTACQLSYEVAQDMIDEPNRKWEAGEIPDIHHGYTPSDISKVINILQNMAVFMRQRRVDNGALRMDQIKLAFELGVKGEPQGFSIYSHSASHRLIEEFMLAANMAVARKLYNDMPDRAFLRRHTGPDMRRIDLVVDEFERFGISVSGQDSKSMQEALNSILDTNFHIPAADQIQATFNMTPAEARQALQYGLIVMLSKPFQPAEYLPGGGKDFEELEHFALAVPLYTHFTSPIRRYADLVVHRLLAECIGHAKSGYKSSTDLQKVASHCNEKYRNAKEADKASRDLYTWAFIRDLENSAFEDKFIVVSVLDKSVDVLSLATGIVQRAYQDKQRCESAVFEKGTVTFVWQSKKGGTVELRLSVATPVRGSLIARHDNTCSYIVRLKPPADAILSREESQNTRLPARN